jgi:predicted nuclease of restriction endonuclease-like (RecB) superfamily
MNYYNDIKDKLIKCEIYDKVKDYSKDRHKVKVYYEIGKLLSEAGKEYGKNIIKQYSEKLMIEVGKKYNLSNLYRMRKFYEIFSNEKLEPLVPKLCWSQLFVLLPLKNIDSIIYYINICEQHNLTKRQLQEKIKNKEYERLSDDVKNKIINKEEINVYDLIPDPIYIKSNSYDLELTEYALKQIVLNNLDEFLLQLGNGFAYLGNEYRIKIGDRYNYIDILLFNIKFNCYIVLEFKITELRKEHIGQIQVYMNYIDNNLKDINQNKTIGIIICKKNNKYVLAYSSDERIISREYIII